MDRPPPTEEVRQEVPGMVQVRQINPPGGTDQVFLCLRVRDGEQVAVRIYGRIVRAERDRHRVASEIAALRKLARTPGPPRHGPLNRPDPVAPPRSTPTPNAQPPAGWPPIPGSAAAATHPHLLEIHDSGYTEDGRLYLVQPFCPRGSLHDHLTTVGRLGPAEVRRIGAKIAYTLAAAHRDGVYHRNLKPTTIVWTPAGEPALTDFALFSLATSDYDYRLPQQRQNPYAAPESFLPELMSIGADIYSLGATLYALLAGWAPHTSDPLAPALDAESVADLPKVPWALMAVIRRAMALDPQQRYASADDMCDALLG